MAASTPSKVAPGFNRNRIAPASLTPVAVETTLTAPDCVVPPTVIEVLVIASERVGSVEACADAADTKPTEASRAAMNTPLSGPRMERNDIRLILSINTADYPAYEYVL